MLLSNTPAIVPFPWVNKKKRNNKFIKKIREISEACYRYDKESEKDIRIGSPGRKGAFLFRNPNQTSKELMIMTCVYLDANSYTQIQNSRQLHARRDKSSIDNAKNSIKPGVDSTFSFADIEWKCQSFH